ncbi:glycerol ethanol, ferric requiring protein [Tulasnella sp. 417]|nr:glycerol ethanol, ferric requiring protein [Tulasnella sp. 417]
MSAVQGPRPGTPKHVNTNGRPLAPSPKPKRSSSERARRHFHRRTMTHAVEEEELESIRQVPESFIAISTGSHPDVCRRYEDFTTIDWIHDSILERNRRLRNDREIATSLRGTHGEITMQWAWAQFLRLSSAGQSWFVVSLAGICIGLNAALIAILTEWLSDLKMGYCSDGWWLNQEFCCWEIETDGEGACAAWNPWTKYTAGMWFIYTTLASLFAYIAAHLVRSFAPYAAGSGISEIKCIISGFVMKGYLGFGTLIIKSLTLPLVIASGLSVGKEGPSVHVACCIGAVVARLFARFSRSQGKMREIITAASAAGVAVAFGSPIGGVLFSIEEMSNVFSIKTMWRSFFCALVATVTLSAMNPYRTGKLVLFQVTYDRDWHFFEIFFFIIIGIFGGLYGVFVTRFNLQVAAFRRKHLAAYPITEAVTLACLTAVFGYFNRFLRIDMTESLYILFRECEGGGDYDNLCQSAAQWPMVNSLLLATMFRFCFVILSYGSKVPAGIFVPSMAIGATFGRMLGIIVKAMYRAYPTSGIFAACTPDVPCITPGTYALLGAAAALSGVMRITVTVVVIMFELTGALTYILPTMIVLLVTKSVGDWFDAEGIADEMIKFNGYPYLSKNEHAFNIPVSRVMRTELQTLAATGLQLPAVGKSTTAQLNVEKIHSTAVKGFPIVTPDDQRILLGYIGRTELNYVLQKAKRGRHVHSETRCTFIPDPSSTAPTADGLVPHLTDPDVIHGMDEDDPLEMSVSTAMDDVLDFGPWVNQTPITVAPQLSLEVVIKLFRQLGPRVILVEQHGTLVGLITVKDVLRFIAAAEHASSFDSNIDSVGILQGVLEEAWLWTPVCNGHVLEKNINGHLDSGCKRYLIATEAADMSGPSKGKASRAAGKSSKEVTLAPIFSQAKPKRPAPPSSPDIKDEIEISDSEAAPQASSSKSEQSSTRPPPFKKPRTTLSNIQAAAPLAERMRPQSLDEVIGHEHITGRDSLLRSLISGGGTGSLILWGPAGCGKTTLARLLAKESGARMVELSATSSGTQDVRAAFEEAKNSLKLTGRQVLRTVLFMDEIHRFNKSQQDLFLPYVEQGLVQLVGATTENPSFRINNALLSRCRVFVLERLTDENMRAILERSLQKVVPGSDAEPPRAGTPEPPASSPLIGDRHHRVSDNVLNAIVKYSQGDARTALSLLELAINAPPSTNEEILLKNLRKSVIARYDRTGDDHYDMISALHKSVRGSDGSAAMYWLARQVLSTLVLGTRELIGSTNRMLTAGEDPLYIARRCIVIASEDVGLANDRALPLAIAAYNACQIIGMPECRINLAHLVAYLAESPKSTRSYEAYSRAEAAAKEDPAVPVPLNICNAPTGLMKELGYGRGYLYNPSYAHPVHNDFLPLQYKQERFLRADGDLEGKVWDEDLLRQWEYMDNSGKDWEGRSKAEKAD